MADATSTDIAEFPSVAQPRRNWGGTQTIALGLAIALLLLLVAYPLLWLVLAALGIPGVPTLEHLTRVATRAQNFNALVNTLQLACGTGLLSINPTGTVSINGGSATFNVTPDQKMYLPPEKRVRVW